jgi:hypothetical protein
VADKFTPEEKRGVVSHMLSVFDHRPKPEGEGEVVDAADVNLVLGIKHVVVPMLTRAFEKGEGTAVLDPPFIKVECALPP